MQKFRESNSFTKQVRSPGPMSKITSDLRVRGRGFISKIRVRGIARIRGDSSKSSGSDSGIISDFRHWTRASVLLLDANKKEII